MPTPKEPFNGQKPKRYARQLNSHFIHEHPEGPMMMAEEVEAYYGPKEELIAELVKELELIHDWNRIERAPLRVQEIQSIERLLAKAHSLTKKN